MNQRERDIETLRLTWELMLPSVPLPLETHLGIWVFHCGDEIGLAIEAIEKTAEHHKLSPLRDPSGFCWSRIKRLITEFYEAQPL